MRSGHWKSSLLALCLLAAGFAGVWQLQRGIDVQRAVMHQERDDLVLRSGRLLKAMSLEYTPLVADLYWTRTVQYYGDKRARRDPNFELLWPLLEVTTRLDPQLLVAYRFGSTRSRAGRVSRDLALRCWSAAFKRIPITGDFMRTSDLSTTLI